MFYIQTDGWNERLEVFDTIICIFNTTGSLKLQNLNRKTLTKVLHTDRWLDGKKDVELSIPSY